VLVDLLVRGAVEAGRRKRWIEQDLGAKVPSPNPESG